MAWNKVTAVVFCPVYEKETNFGNTVEKEVIPLSKGREENSRKNDRRKFKLGKWAKVF